MFIPDSFYEEMTCLEPVYWEDHAIRRMELQEQGSTIWSPVIYMPGNEDPLLNVMEEKALRVIGVLMRSVVELEAMPVLIFSGYVAENENQVGDEAVGLERAAPSLLGFVAKVTDCNREQLEHHRVSIVNGTNEMLADAGLSYKLKHPSAQ